MGSISSDLVGQGPDSDQRCRYSQIQGSRPGGTGSSNPRFGVSHQFVHQRLSEAIVSFTGRPRFAQKQSLGCRSPSQCGQPSDLSPHSGDPSRSARVGRDRWRLGGVVGRYIARASDARRETPVIQPSLLRIRKNSPGIVEQGHGPAIGNTW